jgi:hypothetical protein
MVLKIFRRYKSKTPRVSNLKFLRASVEAGAATASAPLGPLLGQLQIPLLEFCNTFNEYSVECYTESFDLSIRLTKVDSRYVYSIGYSFVSFFIHQLYLDYGLEIEDFIYSYYIVQTWDIWYLSQLHTSVRNIPISCTIRMIFGYFHSSTIKRVT